MKKKPFIRYHVQEFIDYDYLSKLSPKDKVWLEQFTKEYYHNTFNHKEPIHNLEQAVDFTTQTGKKKNSTLKQQLMREDNIRRRDIMQKSGRINLFNDQSINYLLPESTNIEDLLIDYLDNNLKYSKEIRQNVDKLLKKLFH